MSEHTMLPWAISPVRTTEDTAMIVAGDGPDFGLVADVTEDIDAAFILKAVNNHDALVKALEQAKAAMLRTRTASIAGCEEGYGKPEKWADELFSSHGDLTASIKIIEGLLGAVGGSDQPAQKHRNTP